jgi:hypothetical protein
MAHPEMLPDIEKMSQEEMDAWKKEHIDDKWDSLPDAEEEDSTKEVVMM